MDDIIPVWCEGIDPAFWDTEQGQETALQVWVRHHRDAISIADATRIVFDRVQYNRYHYVVAKLPVYRQPYTIIGGPPRYLLRSDAITLRNRRASVSENESLNTSPSH